MTEVLFVLEQPQYHTARIGEVNRFRGAALAMGGQPVTTLRIQRGETVVAECAVDQPCPELAFLQVPNAATCRFEVDLEATGALTFYGNDRPLFTFDPSEAARPEVRAVSEAVAKLPVPDSAMVAVTQGGGDVDSYRSSIITGSIATHTILRDAGVDPDSLDSILDIGCGSGRLLIGWHFSRGGRRTVGVDVNPELIAWNEAHLGEIGEWYAIPPLPPLQFEAESFDLVMLASVFTHMPLAWQRAWIAEIARILRPGGVLLLTLHGRLYVRALLDEAGRELFARFGYAEGRGGEPGANGFSTFHSEEFATALVHPLVPLAIHPAARKKGEAGNWYLMAAWQDVYVLQKPR